MDRGRQSSRRAWLKYASLSGAATTLGAKAAWSAVCSDQTPVEIHEVQDTGCGMREEMPLSPLILEPWKDDLPIPKALAPGWRRVDGTHAPDAPDAWYCRPYAGRPNGGVIYPAKDLASPPLNRGTPMVSLRNLLPLAACRLCGCDTLSLGGARAPRSY